jgi:hypothetical protein
LQLYVNGALNTSSFQTITPSGNTAPLYVGQYGGNADRAKGMIDEVRISSRALTQAEIQNDMNTPIAPPAPDLVSPTVPSNLAAVASSSSQINLSWSASTDDVGVAGYRVTRGGVVIATTTATIFADSGLAAQTAYTYSVAAFDAATNVSAESAPASATPQQAPAATGSPTSRACGTARRFSST